MHKIRSALVTCKMNGRSVSEANLRNHRITSHLEMFITCSGCNLEQSLLEFDNHKCAAAKADQASEANEKKTNDNITLPSKIREEWFVRRTGLDLRGNSCPAFVKVKKLRILSNSHPRPNLGVAH